MSFSKVKGSPRSAALYLAKYLTKDGHTAAKLRRVGSVFGFRMVPKNRLTFVHPCNDSMTYLTRLWGRGQFGPEQIGQIYSSPNCTGDYRTLIVGLDYQEKRRMDSFSWCEDKCREVLAEKPYCDWISEGDTIYEPGRMPRLLEEQPF